MTPLTHLPVLTAELAWRLEQADIHYTESRLGGIQSRQGNPYRVEIWRFGRATAFLAGRMAQVAYFNRVVGLSGPGAPYVPQVVGVYRSQRVPLRAELLPGDLTPTLGERLARYGLRHTDYQAVLYGLAHPEVPPPASGVTVHAARSTDVDLFLDVFLASYGYAEEQLDAARENMRFWYGCPGWRLYLARVDGQPAAVAVLYIDGLIGYLAACATVPQCRNLGCHNALVQARIADAAAEGCELVCAQTQFDTVAQHNLERAGMRVAYTKAVWTERAG